MKIVARVFGIAGILALLLLPYGSAVAAGDALTLVKSTADSVMERLKRDREQLKKRPEAIYPLVEDLVLPHFDFQKMSQWVLGKNWRGASPSQQESFTREFRNLLVRTYAKSLLEYTDQSIRYLPLQPGDGPNRVLVRTEIVQPGGPSIPINYSMYLKDDAWKVYDITVDGISLVANYRSSFASEINQGGIDGLISRLVALNKKGATK